MTDKNKVDLTDIRRQVNKKHGKITAFMMLDKSICEIGDYMTDGTDRLKIIAIGAKGVRFKYMSKKGFLQLGYRIIYKDYWRLS